MLVWVICLTSLVQVQADLLTCLYDPTFRSAENNDISVSCGTERIFLQILLCPVYYEGYNESLLALNAQFSVPECFGIADWSSSPPVLLFNFSMAQGKLGHCANNIKYSSGLSDGSLIQSVNISGFITTWDPSTNSITYMQLLIYQFSCRYPLQYLVNNTEISVLGVSLAFTDDNGTFISTLSMNLFSTADYTSELQMPVTGLPLKTRIYVQVKATNLTEKFNVLLDHCFATTLPFPSGSTFYDLFVGCSLDPQTMVDWNGMSQEAHFSFAAFRFVEHTNLTVSTFYLHCVTRLCENSTCPSLLPKCRKKREVSSSHGSSDVATISSGPIRIKFNTAKSLGCVHRVGSAGVLSWLSLCLLELQILRFI